MSKLCVSSFSLPSFEKKVTKNVVKIHIITAIISPVLITTKILMVLFDMKYFIFATQPFSPAELLI